MALSEILKGEKVFKEVVFIHELVQIRTIF